MIGLMTLWAAFFNTVATCPSFTTLEKPLEIGHQLSSFLSFPATLGVNGGIVVIQFSVGESSEIGKVKVFTSDDELNNNLIRQLTGKRIHLPDYRPPQSYPVKLRFLKSK